FLRRRWIAGSSPAMTQQIWVNVSANPSDRASIPARAIDHVLERQALLEALDLAQHVGDERARVGGGGVVRRDGDLGMAPERARRSERLARKHVERCARERTLRERRQDIGVDLQRAARGIDEVGAAGGTVALEPAEELKVEHALRRRRRRQQADEDLRAAEKAVEPVVAVEGLDVGERLRRAAPASDTEAEASQRHGRRAPEHAQPHHADRDRARRRLLMLMPHARALLAIVEAMTPVM